MQAMSTQSVVKDHRRHCMVVLAYYPGAETRVRRQAEALVDRGYEVDVICLRGRQQAPQDFCNGVQVHRVPVMLKKGGLIDVFLNYLHFFALASLELLRLNRRRRYDVVQVHNLPDFLVFSALLPKLQGVPVILDLHDLMPEFYAGRFQDDRHSWLMRTVLWQEKLSCLFADHVITVSEHWRESLIRRGVPARKCSVVMNVADDKIFQPMGDERIRNGDEFRLLYHGTVVYRYGLDLAIRAVGQVRSDIPNIHLTIIGTGDHVSELVRLTHSLGLERNVTIYGRLRPVEELSGIIRESDIGVVPYRNDIFTDGLLPTKLMEYLATGLPCIAARTAAIERYFGVATELFDPGDVNDLARCILKLHDSPERRKELSEACTGFQERYNWTKTGSEYVSLVERLGRD